MLEEEFRLLPRPADVHYNAAVWASVQGLTPTHLGLHAQPQLNEPRIVGADDGFATHDFAAFEIKYLVDSRGVDRQSRAVLWPHLTAPQKRATSSGAFLCREPALVPSHGPTPPGRVTKRFIILKALERR
jgi:hypothetical protein